MGNWEFKEWVDDVTNVGEWSDLDEDGRDVLRAMATEGLDYRKYDLSPRQILFAIHYICTTGLNAQKAAQMAGYSHYYSRIASSWVRGKSAVKHLQDFISELMIQSGASPKDVTGFLSFVMKADFWGEALEIIDDDTDPNTFRVELNLKKVKALGLTPLIKSIKWHMNGEIQSIELHDAMKAAELLGQAHAMWKKQVEITNITQAAKDAGFSEDDLDAIKQEMTDKALELKRHEAEQRLSSNGASSA